jgi:hypothetical protein
MHFRASCALSPVCWLAPRRPTQSFVGGGHQNQPLTYLRLTNCRLGLLINFGADFIGDGGIARVANGLPPDPDRSRQE